MSHPTLEDFYTTFLAQANLTRKARMALEASHGTLRSELKQSICDVDQEIGILQDQLREIISQRENQEPLALESHVHDLSTSHAERLDSLEASITELEDSVATLQDSPLAHDNDP